MEELMTLLGNVQALLDEIKQTIGGGQPKTETAPPVVAAKAETAMTEEEKKKKEEELKAKTASMAKKAVENTPSAGVDANDDSKKRIEEEPGVNEENVKDVAKQLGVFLKQFKSKNDNSFSVQKDTTNSDMFKEITDVLKQLASNQSNIVKRQETTDEALMNILKGLKIADEVEKSLSIAQKQPVQKGLTNGVDNEKMVNLIKSLTKNDKIKSDEEHEPTAFGRSNFIRKSLHNVDVLKALTGIDE
ncbi:MAG: hypothetical protein MUO85_03775 [candidate division Zixibacteria bacterium]|nr:hypothetical protein [candidate division Zixibacteria bacterium]